MGGSEQIGRCGGEWYVYAGGASRAPVSVWVDGQREYTQTQTPTPPSADAPRISSARRTVDSRCAMTIVVRPAMRFSRAEETRGRGWGGSRRWWCSVEGEVLASASMRTGSWRRALRGAPADTAASLSESSELVASARTVGTRNSSGVGRGSGVVKRGAPPRQAPPSPPPPHRQG